MGLIYIKEGKLVVLIVRHPISNKIHSLKVFINFDRSCQQTLFFLFVFHFFFFGYSFVFSNNCYSSRMNKCLTKEKKSTTTVHV